MSAESVRAALAAFGFPASTLIKDTTREERVEIIRKSLSWCGEGSCDNCGACRLGSGDPWTTYAPYIDGEREIADINAELAARHERQGRVERG